MLETQSMVSGGDSDKKVKDLEKKIIKLRNEKYFRVYSILQSAI